jgi:AraC-like DNA-binding protein
MRRPRLCELRDEQMPEVGSQTRSAALTGYETLASSVGLDPAHMLRNANLPIESLSDPDVLVGVDSVATLLEESARQSRQEAFGLLLAETRRLNNLGVLGLVVREEPTLRAAVEALARYQRIQNGGLRIRLEDDGQVAMIHLELRLSHPTAARQAIEMAAAVTLRTLRTLSNGSFRAVSFCFMHGPPDSLDVHRRVLGVPIEFAQGFDAIICRSSDLDMPVPEADPALSRSLKRWLDRQLAEDKDEPLERIRQVVKSLLPTGTCSAEQVAAHLGTHRRTLNRRLAVAGESISSVIDDVRAELAQSYLASGMHPIYEIADLLGFACGPDLSRWFRCRFGMTASQWMDTHHAQPRSDPKSNEIVPSRTC